MTELSNAVTVLIARMESHPEDFKLYGMNRARFGETARALYGLVGMDEAKAGAYWFLTDADKEALTEAWKKYHRAEMEKEVMETIFDDGAEEREREMVRMKLQQQVYQNQIAAQNQLMQSTGTYQTTISKPGQLIPMSNAAQNNTGLLGSAANAFSGIFK